MKAKNKEVKVFGLVFLAAFIVLSFAIISPKLNLIGQAIDPPEPTCGNGIIDSDNIIIDDPEAAYIGTWETSSSTSGYYGSGYRHDKNQGAGKTASFTPDIPADGDYKVSLWWTSHANRANNVSVTITHAAGTYQTTVNQREQGSQWNSLGTYRFSAGTGGSVILGSTNTGVTISDAVKFELIGGGNEECDDGNNDNGDGCDSNCNLETGWYCEDEPSICAKIGEITIEWNDVKQEIEGFGACTAYMANDFYYLQNKYQDHILDTLFKTDTGVTAEGIPYTGIGLNRLMVRTHSAFNPEEDVYQWGFVGYSADMSSQIRFVNDSLLRGDFYLHAQYSKPGDWMLTANNNLKREHYQDFADSIIDYINYSSDNYGIRFSAISPANEPDLGYEGDSSHYEPEELADFIGNYLKPSLEGSALNIEVVAPDISRWKRLPEYAEAILNHENASQGVDIISGHMYDHDWLCSGNRCDYGLDNISGKRLWQTEISKLNNAGTFHESLILARLIHTMIKDHGASAYDFWWFVSYGDLSSALIIHPFHDTNTYTITPKTYAMGQFSRFIRPGYKLIGDSGVLPHGVYVSAYKNDSDFAIVAINTNSGSKDLTFNLGGFAATSITPYITDVDRHIEQLPNETITNNVLTYTMPARSIVTFVNTKNITDYGGNQNNNQGNTVIQESTIDDDNATNTDYVGAWTESTGAPGYYGSGYKHDNQGPGKSVTFTPEIHTDGDYKVSLWWTEHANRADDVLVTITHETGTDQTSVNQREQGSQWNSIGTYPFSTGTTSSVMLSSSPTSSGYVIADAVKFELLSSGTDCWDPDPLTDPHPICTCSDLQNIGSAPLTWNYELQGDIDCSETATWNEDPVNPGTYFGFDPIGDSSNRFQGIFNGNDFVISDLYINRDSASGDQYDVGLFGGNEGTITNIGLENAYVLGGQRVGALVAYNDLDAQWENGMVSNSYMAGEVHGNNKVGGLIGQNNGQVSSSYASGVVTGIDGSKTEIGGLVGSNSVTGEIENSFADATVSGINKVGGLVGYSFIEIANSYSTGEVIGKYGAGDRYIGGLAGGNQGSILSSYSTSHVNYETPGGTTSGGLVGECVTVSIINSDWYNNQESCCGSGTASQCTKETGAYSAFYDYNSHAVYHDIELPWDFITSWDIFCNLNGYPSLQIENIDNTANCRTTDFAGEICGNGIDDDLNGDTDCQDVACPSTGICSGNCALPECDETGPGATFQWICTENDLDCSGNCVDCIGSGNTYNCQAVQSSCTGDCSLCSGSGTTFNCQANEADCSDCNDCNEISPTEFNCQALTDGSQDGSCTGTEFCCSGTCTPSPIFYGNECGTDECQGIMQCDGTDYKCSTMDNACAYCSQDSSYTSTCSQDGECTLGTLQQECNTCLRCIDQGLTTDCIPYSIEQDLTEPNQCTFLGIGCAAGNCVCDGAGTCIQNMGCPLGMSGSNTEIDPCLITDCVELQAMNAMLNNIYKLNDNIDCSMTNPLDPGFDPGGLWGDLTGFNPIGDCGLNGGCSGPASGDNNPFTGKLYGNDKTITGLYINKPTENGVGLFGITSDTAEISNINLINAEIIGQNGVGVLMGYNRGLIQLSSASGNVNGDSGVGVLVGTNSNLIQKSSSAGTSTGSTYVGGLSGENYGQIQESYSNADVNGYQTCGGLVGSNYQGTIQDSYATGTATGDPSSNNIGGLVGRNYGLSGTDAIIERSYSTGTATASGNMGGLVGENYAGVGGQAIIRDCYYSGNMFNNGESGAIAANNYGIGTSPVARIENTHYYNDNLNPCVASGGGQGSSEDCTQQPNEDYFFTITNEPMDLWDYTNVWDDSNDGLGYPDLQWQTSGPTPEICNNQADDDGDGDTDCEDSDCIGQTGPNGFICCQIEENCNFLDDDCANGICDLNYECKEDFLPSTTVCRAEAAGGCDIEETCTGTSAACPADSFLPATTVCNPVAGLCDVEETCPGTSATCPTDVFLTAGTVCRAEAAGGCDIEETCTGTSASCPTDVFEPSTTVCNTATEPCDESEFCPGNSAACPADSVSPTTKECRSAADLCDVAENCDGINKQCPTNIFAIAGTQCSDVRDCPSSTCNGFFAEIYPPDDYDKCDGLGTCIPHSCAGTTPFCSDDDSGDGVNTQTCSAPCDQDIDCPAGTCNPSTCTCTTGNLPPQMQGEVRITTTNPSVDDTHQNITSIEFNAIDNEADAITYAFNWYENNTPDSKILYPNGLISYWSFDSNIDDEIGANDGLNKNSIPTQDGKLNGAYSFNGNAYLRFANEEYNSNWNFDNTSQGGKQWYYTDYNTHHRYLLNWNGYRWTRGGDEFGYDFTFIEQYVIHPPADIDTAHYWMPPRNGNIRITAKIKDLDVSGGDGIRYIITEYDQATSTNIYNQAFGNGFNWQTITLNRNINTNHEYFFRVDSKHNQGDPNQNDATLHNISIKYTDMTKDSLEGINHGDPYSISSWVKITNAQYNKTVFADNYKLQLVINEQTPQVIGPNNKTVILEGSTIPLNQWVMLTLTYDGTLIKLYRNNILEDTTSKTNLYTNFDGFRIGMRYSTERLTFVNPNWIIREYGDFFEGSIDEVMLYNRVLTPTEINQMYLFAEDLSQEDSKLYKLNATTLITDGLMHYYPLDNNPKDYLSNNDGIISGTQNDAVLDPTTYKIGSGSYYFDGWEDSIELTTTITNDELTYAGWIKLQDADPVLPQKDVLITGGICSGFSDPPHGGIIIRDDPAIVQMYAGFIDSNYRIAQANINLYDDQWHFLVGTSDSTGTYLYVDGKLVASTTYKVSDALTPETTTIGSYCSGGITEWPRLAGWADEVMIYNRALSPDEIRMLYTAGNVSGRNLHHTLTEQGDKWKLGVIPADEFSWGEELNSSPVTILPDYPPQINILSPIQDQTYTQPVDFTLTANEELQECKFTLDNWLNEYIMSTDENTAEYLDLSLTTGSYTAKFSCTDLKANINDTEEVSFSVDIPSTCTDIDNDGYGDEYGNYGSPPCTYDPPDCDDETSDDVADFITPINLTQEEFDEIDLYDGTQHGYIANQINPGKTELCNKIDDNCDGYTDNGQRTPADTNSDCCVSGIEIALYVTRWKNNEVTDIAMAAAVIAWKESGAEC